MMMKSFLLFLGAFLLLAFPQQCLASNNNRRLQQLYSTPMDFVNEYLAPHNRVRASFGLPPLQWSDELARYAEWWAHQRQGDCAMIHSHGNYGENLFWGGTGRQWGAEDAVAFWFGEKSFYDYSHNSCEPGKECLHYTQLVWRQSERVGCAKVICANGYTFIGCNYDPHGNVLGQKPF